MAIMLKPHEIVSRILQKYPIKDNKGCLLRFEKQIQFSKEFSYWSNLSQFIELMDKTESKGFEIIGGYTERGVYNLLKNIASYIHEFIQKKRENIGFINLYWIYFYRRKSPSGMLVIMPFRFIFIPGLTDINQELFIDYTSQPESRKQILSSNCKKRNLKWWGDVRNPVVFRDCEINTGNFEIFLADILTFFHEVGYAEV